MTEWVFAFESAKLEEGSVVRAKVKDIPVVLARVEGKAFALLNQCPHMGCFLHKGKLSGYLLTCPCHDWVFDIKSGEFTAAPEIKIPTFPVREEGGEISIEIGGYDQ